MSENDKDSSTSGTNADATPATLKRPGPTKGQYAALFALTAGIALIGYEMKNSTLEQYIFTRMANGTLGASMTTKTPPAESPRDKTLGYASSVAEDTILRSKKFDVTPQKEWQEHSFLGLGLYPIYEDKMQAGLHIYDTNGTPLFVSDYPREAFKSFENIPETWWKSLLLVENNELLADRPASKNVVIEWDRTILAIAQRLGVPGNAGGSGLATQNEKILHSKGAVTAHAADKARQMLSASVRYYSHANAEKIILNYMESVPLSSTPLDGEVFGFAAGMKTWYGRNLDETTRILNQPEDSLSYDELKLKAQVYREAFSLVMAVKKPSYFFNGPHKGKTNLTKAERQKIGRTALENRIDIYLPKLVASGIISEKLAELVKLERLQFVDQSTRARPTTSSSYKFINTMRIKTQQTLKIPSLYDLDRRDLSVQSTMDGDLNKIAEKILTNITDPAFAKANGLVGGRDLLDENGTQFVKASFTLYERMPDGRNVLRVQTDNLGNDPLNLNEGGKLELGSTAKFRWGLAPYQMTIGKLHDKYNTYTPEALQKRLNEVSKEDALTRWALSYFLDPETDKSFPAMLNASMERKYSGNPNEAFATGGGVLKVQNFDRKEDSWNCTVRVCFHHSVNASFIRIMRDIVKYTIYEEMGVDAAIYDDINDPMRGPYLEQFAKSEGSIFLSRALKDQQNKTGSELDSFLAQKIKKRHPGKIAALYMYLHPQASVQDLEKFVRAESDPDLLAKFIAKNTPKKHVADKPVVDAFTKLHKDYAPGVFERPATAKKSANYDLNDRAYITKIHPLALWVAKFKSENPTAKWADIVAAADTVDKEKGVSVFHETYSWLFKPTKMAAQNRSLRRIIEEKAFNDYLLPQARSLGYPFNKVVPSYGTVLGSSGDTPAALAKLLGIVQNDGVMKKANIFWNITRAEDTPYEKIATPILDTGKQVMKPEIARSLREELQGVVNEGTGGRLKNIIKLPDGTIIPNGGKTGSGNNVVKSGNGQVLEVKNRTATWTFTIGDRFFGTTLLYVDGSPVTQPDPKNPDKKIVISQNPAAKAHFTSATAVITTKILFSTPEFQNFLQRELRGEETQQADIPANTLDKKPVAKPS